MEKYSKEYMDNLANIAACIVGSEIASSQMADNSQKKNLVLQKQQEALNALEEFGVSLQHQYVGDAEIKIPEYSVIDIENGNPVLKFGDNFELVRYWYYKFTSY